MTCIINGRLIMPDTILEGMAIRFDDKIREIATPDAIDMTDCAIIDAAGQYVAPGLVDIHIHGYVNEDVSDGSADGIRRMAAGIAKNGVTSWCPTTMTVSMPEIEAAFEAVREVKAGSGYGAKVLGINCEGPFINPSKKGAQAEEHILPPDGDFILANADILKLYTVAPEMPGALECIKKTAADGRVLASMGHTGAGFDEANAGIAAGVRHTTHLFNAMTGLLHRNPGVVGAALSDERVSCELIADTFHVNTGLYAMVHKLKGDKLCLITDCMRAGGMPDGNYTLGGQKVIKKGITCLLEDGTIAGSVLTLDAAVRNLYKHANVPLHEAVACASLHPAMAVGEAHRIGSLAEGKAADIIFMDSDLHVTRTIIDGQ